MKKILIASALIATLLVGCDKQKEQAEDSTTVQLAALNERYEMAQDAKDSLIFLMSDIYSGVEEINIQEGLLFDLRGTDDGVARQEIIENLSRIKANLQDKQSRLDALTAQLNTSNDKNGYLAKEVQRLKSLISQKESRIAQLEGDLNNANKQISDLNEKVTVTEQKVQEEQTAKEQALSEVEESKAVNEKLVNDANKVYYAMGTKKELESHNILHKKKLMQGDYEMSYFTQADRRSLSVIPCNSKKVKILTNQPADSYKIEEGSDKIKTIVITNPTRFWNTSNFLVIQTN